MLARILVQHCAAVRPGDLVTIVADPRAMHAVEAVYSAVLHAGGHPSYHAKCENLQAILLRHGSDSQLTHVCPFEFHRLKVCDVLMVLSYLTDAQNEGTAPSRAAMAQAARRGLMTMSLGRAARSEVRYVLCDIPSPASARDAGMLLDAHTDWVYRAGLLHLPDPLGAWRELHTRQERAREYLQAKKVLRFRTPAADAPHPHDGTDLTVDVSGRTWINCAGGENFPDGEIFTGPRGVEGVVNFTHPACYRGHQVDGVRLRFRDGRVVDASATANEDYLIHMLDMDDGARIAGEIALGTNYAIDRFTRNTFYDEKIGGTFHVALGAGYPQTGNTNESGLHWDMVCDLRHGGTVAADGQVIQRDGIFVFDDWPRPS